MKLIARIRLFERLATDTLPDSHYLPKELFWKVAEHFPSLVVCVKPGRHILTLEFEPDTRDAHQAISVLENNSIIAWSHKFLKPPVIADKNLRYVPVEGTREFHPIDFKQAELFHIWTRRKLCDNDNSRETRLRDPFFRVVAHSLNPRVPVGGAGISPNILCQSSFRELLEAQAFRGLAFRPVKGTGSDSWLANIHEMWSNIVLPRFASPPMMSSSDSVWDGKIPEGSWINVYPDDIFAPTYFRLNREEVKQRGEFDFAVSCEPINAFPSGMRVGWYIASRRFREWCLEQRFAKYFGWNPVGLDG